MTDALLGAETLVLVVLVMLVVGLLRSHAEILRRLGPPAEDELVAAHPAAGPPVAAPVGSTGPPDPGSAPRRRLDTPAAAIAGQTLSGDAVALSFAGGGPPTLLAFLSSGCASCRAFFAELETRPLPDGITPVIVAKGGDRESPARLRELAPRRLPVVLSTRAWEEYGVPGSPYFVLVEGTVRGEGVATTWDGLASLLGDARADLAATAEPLDRLDEVERRLVAAGIGPGDPSLYPASGGAGGGAPR